MCLSSLFFILFFAVTALVLVAVYLAKSPMREALTQTAGILGAQKKKFISGYSGFSEETEYHYRYHPGSKNSPSYFEVRIPCPGPGSFKLAREGGLDGFFKNLGIASEIQTGDPEFDGRYYIETDVVEFTRAVFESREKRDQVRDLFGAGFTAITLKSGQLAARITPYRPMQDSLLPDFILNTVKMLKSLGSRLPWERVNPAALEENRAWQIKKYALFALTGLSLTTGLILTLYGEQSLKPLDRGLLFRDSLRYTVPAFLGFLMISANLLKGRASSHREWLGILLLGLFTFPLAGYGGVMFLNAHQDPGQASLQETLVLNAHYHRGKNSTTYYLDVRSWREGRSWETLSVPSSIYRRAVPGKTRMRVMTKPGKLGYEWLVNYTLET